MEKSITKNQELIQKVEAALTKIRPYLEADGGDLQVIEITEEGVLKVQFLGACSDCSMSVMTLKSGVEQTVLSAVPEIVRVEAIE